LTARQLATHLGSGGEEFPPEVGFCRFQRRG
jgi:hypothetical protein